MPNDQALSQQDIQDLQVISSRLPAGHPTQKKINTLLSAQPTQYEKSVADTGFLHGAGEAVKEFGKSLASGPAPFPRPSSIMRDIREGPAKRAAAAKQWQSEKQAGYSLPYRIAAQTGIVNAPAMEEAAAHGGTGEILGRAAVPAAAAVAPLASEGMVRGVRGAGSGVRALTDEVGKWSLKAPEGIKLPLGFRFNRRAIMSAPAPQPGPAGTPTSAPTTFNAPLPEPGSVPQPKLVDRIASGLSRSAARDETMFLPEPGEAGPEVTYESVRGPGSAEGPDELTPLAKQGRPGAGAELTRRGKRVLYLPQEQAGRGGTLLEKMRQSGTTAPAPPQTLSDKIAYQPLSPAEHADLENEAGRPLTEDEAYDYIKRRTQAGAVANMLAGAQR
jgi:hypothetical protein